MIQIFLKLIFLNFLQPCKINSFINIIIQKYEKSNIFRKIVKNILTIYEKSYIMLVKSRK
nr:MAG TPA: hypothetical protein [Caudoviricetes sp.]